MGFLTKKSNDIKKTEEILRTLSLLFNNQLPDRLISLELKISYNTPPIIKVEYYTGDESMYEIDTVVTKTFDIVEKKS